MKHYIITRFNADVFPTREDLAKRRQDKKWLKYRLALFKKYTYPSICAQTEQNFGWIVWMSLNTPQWLYKEMKQFDRATVVYALSYEEHIDRKTDVLITTRIDNDDMIHNRFIEVTQLQIPEFERSRMKRMVYSFKKGYRYIVAGRAVELADQYNSPFLSLFVRPEKCKKEWDVYCTMHGDLPDLFPCVYNDKLRAWMWLEHQRNTSGIEAPRGARVHSRILKDFR